MKINKEIIKNTGISDVFYLFVLQGLNSILPLVIMPYLAIKIGASHYGYVGFSFAFAQYFNLIIDFGFNLSATKRIAIYKDNKDELSKIFYSTLYAKLLLLILSTIFFFLLTYIYSGFEQYRKSLFVVYPMLISSTFTFTWFFQGIGEIKKFSIISSMCKVLILPLIFFCVKNQNDYLSAIFIQVLSYLSIAVISNIVLIRNNYVSYFRFSKVEVRKEFIESFPLFLSSASISVYTQLFTIILGVFSTPRIVGIYSTAEKIMRSVFAVCYFPISQTFYPRISYYAIKDKTLAIKIFNKVLKSILIIMVILFIFLFSTSNYIDHILGATYNGISLLLKIFSLAPVIIGTGAVLGQLGLVALGDRTTKRTFRKVYMIAAPFSFFIALFMIYLFKDIGAAIALMITEFFVAFAMLYNVSRLKIIK